MDTFYLICAGGGGALVICQFLAALFGLAGDHDTDTHVDAHTGDGTIRSELQLNSGGDSQVSRRTVRGNIGSGGKVLKIRTGDGDIRLKIS